MVVILRGAGFARSAQTAAAPRADLISATDIPEA
jgi:hypothetical protein